MYTTEEKQLFKFVFRRILKKSLLGLHSTGGRNFLGRVCVHHKGGGLKRRYLLIDRFRRLGQHGYVFKIFKDRLQSPEVGALLYDNGLIGFVSLVCGMFAGLRLFSGAKIPRSSLEDFAFSEEGSSSLLSHIGLFTVISSIELYP